MGWRTSRHLAALVGLALCAPTEYALCIERIWVEAGAGNYVEVAGIGVGSTDWKRWAIDDKWWLSIYGVGGVAYWRGDSDHSDNRELVDFSVAPVLRFERAGGASVWPYLEASIGLHLLSHTRINEGRDFSTGFQFGEFIGAGLSFGRAHQYEISLRLQHVSNGGIRNPNDGLTYGAMVIQYRLPQH